MSFRVALWFGVSLRNIDQLGIYCCNGVLRSEIFFYFISLLLTLSPQHLGTGCGEKGYHATFTVVIIDLNAGQTLELLSLTFSLQLTAFTLWFPLFANCHTKALRKYFSPLDHIYWCAEDFQVHTSICENISYDRLTVYHSSEKLNQMMILVVNL